LKYDVNPRIFSNGLLNWVFIVILVAQ
jgi:hypothetical protein